jgi:hypothetical protein
MEYEITPRLRNKIWRAEEGACRDASDSHPKWPMDPRLERSIAKRATGTILAILGSLAQRRAESVEQEGTQSPPARRHAPRTEHHSVVLVNNRDLHESSRQDSWRSLHRTISRMSEQEVPELRRKALTEAASLIYAWGQRQENAAQAGRGRGAITPSGPSRGALQGSPGLSSGGSGDGG